MSASDHIAHYESIALVMGRMFAAASALDWDKLAAAEIECAKLVARARRLPDIALEPCERARKTVLIQSMLRDDARIRDLANPELKRLGRLLDGPRLAVHAEAVDGGTPGTSVA
jgi:flagellar protein FliT